ncbi:TPR-like protein [Myriangium duriaei CBS 260.36]|uniref:TPR-like protein n=1 Tax=Myriangium duriaei CBS 260.36 TaxID=1168546 RepID=A0A9P4J4F6_9PEZI|nr:TPR-like protein [Myriangium duriaei CBS 260.36]
MSGTKAALKAAKSAIDESNWDEVIKQSETVLEADRNNYFAKLFLGRAYEKKNEIDKAAKVYHEAANLKPDDTQAWQGLASLYESQGAKYLDAYGEVAVKLAVLFAQANDMHRSQSIIDKLTLLAKKNGNPAQHKRALQVLLPGSPVWGFLEGRVQHPSITFRRLIDITEKEEQARISKEIAERRTRIGARLGKVTEEVKREVYEQSDLEALLRGAIDWTDDDTTRRELEEKLFQRAYDTLVVMPSELKDDKRAQVIETARGMVIVKHPFRLAWDVHIEWQDRARIESFDVTILQEYLTFFPEAGLSRVLRAYLRSEVSPFSLPSSSEDDESDDTATELLPEDRLLLMAEGLGDGKSSPLAHRMTAEYYLSLEEYESAIDTVRTGLKLLKAEENKAAMTLQEDRDAFNTILATSLVHHQSPKNHPEAKALMEDILQRKSDSAPALAGLGLVYEEEGNYPEAIKYLSQALKQEPNNIRIRVEAAWCNALSGQYQQAVPDFEACLDDIRGDDPKSKDLRATVQYRIGRCIWEIDSTKAARKDRKGAYSYLLASIKSNVNFAPAYTSLGFYYADYAKDKKRARQCFQKAFELSASEVEAAERLATAFADQGEWDVVELVAQRVVDSGKTKPSPGSRKKGISWPFSALGVVQMTRQEYSQAITSFLSALRISPNDYHSYVGLGESYHNSGRYNSASRTFHYAEAPHDGVEMKISGEKWFTEYMLANVHRELGDHDEAIELLQGVLADRPDEFGVLLALLQTYIERSWRRLDTGFFGKAAESARQALELAGDVAKSRPEAFNLWKAVGDACSVFHWTRRSVESFPGERATSLLKADVDSSVYDLLADVDKVNAHTLDDKTQINGDAGLVEVSEYLKLSLLAYKRAVHCCSHDIHAQAVAWYNLGWAEYRAYCELPSLDGRRFSMAAVRCFKRAIELEAGNSEFWNALGVVTSGLNVKVAQHAFIRSLYLNERSAQTWTNLGVLYLNNHDTELAHQAFGRAQSTDPDCAHAWLGEGLIALSIGDNKEALSHFVHAFEISDCLSLLTKKQYTISVFDSLISKKTTSSELTQLIQPLFALRQLHAQVPADKIFQHLSALLSERVGDHTSAITTLSDLTSLLEAEYETTESPAVLLRFAHANSDLARNHLALHSYVEAIDHATTALDLTSDLPPETQERAADKIRLSAHLTAGLANFYSSQLDDSIVSFRAALAESNSNPAVVCLLSQVLWAHNGASERTVAREQLEGCVEAHPQHVQAWVLLGAMAGLEGDDEALGVIRGELVALMGEDGVGEVEREQISQALVAMAGVKGDVEDEVRRQVVLRPDRVAAWSALAGLAEGGDADYAANMALLAAGRAVPPLGAIEAERLAKAYAGTGELGHTQKAVMLAPWEAMGESAQA